MVEPAGAGQVFPRAFLRLGGRTLARHQLDNVLALKCDKLICIGRRFSSELLEIQHAAEASGISFHLAFSPADLAKQIRAADDLFVFSEGFLAASADIFQMLEGGHVILVQPIEDGLSAGFERIDLNWASAGIMRIPGRLLEGLFELEPDCDVSSALTRIALQSGLSTREVPAQIRLGANWRMVRSESEAAALEGDWLREKLDRNSGLSPGRFIANAGVLAFGSSLLQTGHAGRTMMIGSVVSLALALGAGWVGLATLGLMICVPAWIFLVSTNLLHRVESGNSQTNPIITAMFWVFDAVLILLSIWSVRVMPWQSVSDRIFAPFILILLVRFLQRIVDNGWTRWIGDRALLAVLLAVAAAMGILSDVVRVLVVSILLAGLLTKSMDRS